MSVLLRFRCILQQWLVFSRILPNNHWLRSVKIACTVTLYLYFTSLIRLGMHSSRQSLIKMYCNCLQCYASVVAFIRPRICLYQTIFDKDLLQLAALLSFGCVLQVWGPFFPPKHSLIFPRTKGFTNKGHNWIIGID